MLEIKRLPADRWREYRNLRLEALRSEPRAFGSSPEREEGLTGNQWRRRSKNTIVALWEGKPVGVIGLVFNDRPKTKHVADIVGFYVSDAYRGQGVGTRLLEEALSAASKKRGVLKVKLAVNPDQRAALKLYKSAGFRVTGRLKKELKVGHVFLDEVMMEKFL